uniref:Odorant receptor n=1 Tax=Apis cerana cerana TaxID=94128 RepID=A0A1P8LK43_APICC|nr:odorant receptor 170 [Apis cerana cerana]
MNFQNLNRLNAFANMISGNFLPMNNINEKLSIILKINFVIAWIIELIYVTASFLGLFNVSGEKALKDGTVNIAISFEVIIFNIYLHSRKKLLYKLIGKLNHLLITEDEIFRSVIIDTVKPLEMPLKIYVIASVASLMIWILSPLIKLFQKNEFYYEDFIMPAVFSKQPFSNDIFICGIFLQLLGGEDTIIRKISLDIYTIYLCLLITAQYKYLRIKFAIILKEKHQITKDLYKNIIWQNDNVRQEMKLLTRHFETVIETTTILKKLISPNIGFLYLSYVFRFCFLSFMFAMTSAKYFEKCLLASYTIGALIQFYILCYCIQRLFEASSSIADDVVYEKWYSYDIRFQRVILMISLANELKCKISNFQNIDLTLPSFMSILNQAYSVCLLFLKARQD